jgi:hypothetical protein
MVRIIQGTPFGPRSPGRPGVTETIDDKGPYFRPVGDKSMNSKQITEAAAEHLLPKEG